VTRAIFNGYEALTFSDYTDLATGMTLRAEPGGVYDIAPASGRVVPEFPEPWFTRAEALAAPVSRFAKGGIVPAPEEPERAPEAEPAAEDEQHIEEG